MTIRPIPGCTRADERVMLRTVERMPVDGAAAIVERTGTDVVLVPGVYIRRPPGSPAFGSWSHDTLADVYTYCQPSKYRRFLAGLVVAAVRVTYVYRRNQLWVLLLDDRGQLAWYSHNDLVGGAARSCWTLFGPGQGVTS